MSSSPSYPPQKRNKTVEKKKKNIDPLTESQEPSSMTPPMKKNIKGLPNLNDDINESDLEMPKDAVQCKMKKIIKIKDNKKITTIRRIFLMKDGTEEVHEDINIDII